MNAQVANLLSKRCMVARLTNAFGLLALVLASDGLYGAPSCNFARREPEIGMLMTLGSDRMGSHPDVRGSMLQTCFSFIVGDPAVLFAGHFLQSHLFGLKGDDREILLSVSIDISALLARIILAPRASSVDAIRALRSE